MFGIIWFVVGLLITCYSIFQLGRTGDLDYALVILLGILWPFALVMAIVFAPFIVIYYLGKSLRK